MLIKRHSHILDGRLITYINCLHTRTINQFKMDSLISGIIDCVARPSTTDSPVRVIRKSSSESPHCVSTHPGPILSNDDSPQSVGADSDSDSTTTPPPPNHVRGTSSGSMSRLLIPDEAMPINSVLTAEGIIMGDEGGICCGDYAAYYDGRDGDGDDGTVSSESIDSGVVRQFEAAFATFLYKNPAFNNMSHRTLQKVRTKLLKESARNIKVEAELRQQLEDLQESKRNRELELQRELLQATRAKAEREAELLVQIQKKRQSCMKLDQQLQGNSTPLASPASPAAASVSSPATTPSSITGSDSFEEFQKEIRKNKMEQAHILAEMEKIKMKIAEESIQGTP